MPKLCVCMWVCVQASKSGSDEAVVADKDLTNALTKWIEHCLEAVAPLQGTRTPHAGKAGVCVCVYVCDGIPPHRTRAHALMR